jgi:hypothetical protein
MRSGVALLQDLLQELRRLISDDGFALSILAVVGAGTVLAYGFGATSDIVVSILVLGVMTALAEQKLRTKK